MSAKRLPKYLYVWLAAALWLNLAGAGSAWADHLNGVDDEMIALNNQLIQLAQKVCDGNDKQKENFAELVEKRKAKLLEKVEKDPEHVGIYFLPAETAHVMGLCEEAAELLEVKFEGEGTADVMAVLKEEEVSGPSVYYFLNTQSGKIQLYFAKNPALKHGDEVKVKGMRSGNWVFIDNLQAEGGSGSVQATSSALTMQVTGNRSVLCMIANRSNRAASTTVADATGRLFTNPTSVNSLWQESSFGSVSFSGDVIGPFSVSGSTSDPCNYTTWASELENAARNAGYTPSNYQHKVYVVPADTCGWIGGAYQPGTQVWVIDQMKNGVPMDAVTSTYSHELGHNVGINHAASVNPSTGAITEYGDTSDDMGYATGDNPKHHNAAHKKELGWLSSSAVVAPSTGTYAISQLETTGGSAIQALRIPKPDTNQYYYVSFRAGVGLDSNLSSAYKNLTSIHRWSDGGGTFTYFLKALGDGMNFNDSVNGVSITQVSHTANSATLSVTVSTPGCTQTTPGIGVSTQTPPSVTPGFSATYTVNVTNRNIAAYCSGTETFDLSKTIPAGWNSTISPSSLSLSSGQTGSAALTVTPPVGTANGTHLLTATATNRAHPELSSLYPQNCLVFNDTTSPTTTLTSAPSRRRVDFTAQASDNVAVLRVEFYLDGASTPFSTSTYAYATATLNTRNLSAGTHSVTAKAYDYSNNAAFSNAVTFTVGSSGGGRH